MANKKKCPGCQKFISPTASYCLYCGMQFADIEEDTEDGTNIPVNEPASIKMKPLTNQGTEEQSFSQPKDTPYPNTPIKPVNTIKKVETEPLEERNIQTKNTAMSSDSEEEFLKMLDHTAPSGQKTIVEDDPDEDEYRRYVESEDNEVYEDEAYEDEEILDDSDDEIDNESEEPKDSKKPSLRNALAENSQKAFSKIGRAREEKHLTKRNSNSIEKPERKPAKKNQQNEEQRDKFDPNYDEYYNNLIGLVDAEKRHITIENVIKTISIIALFIIVVLLCLFFV